MFSHVFVGTNDCGRATAFYDLGMVELGWEWRHLSSNRQMVIQRPRHAKPPLFLLGTAFDGQLATPGNDVMAAFTAQDRATVGRVFARALAAGGASEGAPGLRAHYYPDYYGAHFRNLDGNKLCVVCHEPA